MVINVLVNINLFLFAVGTAAAFAIGTYLFQSEIITIGTVYIIYHYTSMLNRPMDSIAHQIEQLQRASAGIVRIQALFAVESKIKKHVGNPDITINGSDGANDLISTNGTTQHKSDRKLSSSPLAVRFDHVSFGYDDSLGKNGDSKKNGTDSSEVAEKDIVLQNISFSLAPGKILGLLGRTGSGKTTLTRLLFRFYDPDVGCISMSSDSLPGLIDIRNLPLEILRGQVGMVTQNIQLFNASVRDKLTFFDSSVSALKIEHVINELGLDEWFSSLPNGLDTTLESGGSLSAGEAQLLALTRIFLKSPGLIVLDEASSRLDPATEALINGALERLVTGRTAIIIAHRLDTVRRADEIMILNQGSIEEYGSRDVLANDPNSRFHNLLKTGIEEVLV